MRYRGFEITNCPDSGVERYDSENNQDVICEGFYCQVYPAGDEQYADQLDDFCLAEGFEIDDCSDQALESGIIMYIDENYYMLCDAKADVVALRKKKILSKVVRWIEENESSEELYHILSDTIGMTDDEIIEIGFTSLVPYFDRKIYAQIIAEYLIDKGTERTLSGNIHIPFSEINKRYAVNLPSDLEMLDLIRYSLRDYSDILSDIEIETDFDMMFNTIYCPFAKDDPIDENFLQMNSQM